MMQNIRNISYIHRFVHYVIEHLWNNRGNERYIFLKFSVIIFSSYETVNHTKLQIHFGTYFIYSIQLKINEIMHRSIRVKQLIKRTKIFKKLLENIIMFSAIMLKIYIHDLTFNTEHSSQLGN